MSHPMPPKSEITWVDPSTESKRDGTYRLGWKKRWRRVYMVRWHPTRIPGGCWIMDTGAKAQPELIADVPYPKFPHVPYMKEEE